jgi:hypothetical protein
MVLLARVMDNLHRGIVAPQLYRPEQMGYWEEELRTETDLFELRHQGVYLGFAALRQVGGGFHQVFPPHRLVPDQHPGAAAG